MSGGNVRNRENLELPDGTIIAVAGDKRVQILKALISSTEEEAIAISDLAIAIYGSSNKTARQRTSTLVSDINSRILTNTGWVIHQPVSRSDWSKGGEARYFLKKR